MSYDGVRRHVVVERRGQMRALFQLVIVEVEILGHLAPAMTVKVVVDAPLIGAGLDLRLHAGTPRDPDPLVFVIPPVSVVSVKWVDEEKRFKIMLL